MADTRRLLEQLPPHSSESERALLGCILFDGRCLDDVASIVGSEDFFFPRHGLIFQAALELHGRNDAVDGITVLEFLRDRNHLDFDGTEPEQFFIDLVNEVPSAYHAADYAKTVRDKSRLTKLIRAAGEILHEAYESSDDAAKIINDAERRIFELAHHEEAQEIVRLASGFDAAMESLENSTADCSRIQTGYTQLDRLTGGLHVGEFVIIAGRTSMGKTSFALNIAQNMAKEGVEVGFFSLEMSQNELCLRTLILESRVSSTKIRGRMLDRGDLQDLGSAAGRLMDVPMFLDHSVEQTPLSIRAKARRMVRKHGIKVLFVDYLQLVESPGGRRDKQRHLEVAEISRALKQIARELEIPVVALAQLNRGVEGRTDHRPMMSDLRESGSLEQDADAVLLLHHLAYYKRDDAKWKREHPELLNVIDVIVAKQRNGPPGVVRLNWDASTMAFRNYQEEALFASST